MKSKHQVHNLIILDESGSMNTIKRPIVEGFNEIVQTIQETGVNFPEQEHYISFVTFNGIRQKLIHNAAPAMELKELNFNSYKPNASTPLFDAIGNSVVRLKEIVENLSEYNVLVTILTDGMENASVEYSLNNITSLIEELKKNKWTFTYIGTDHNVKEFASSLKIYNSLSFEKSGKGIKDLFSIEKNARMVYMKKIRDEDDTENDYYK